ncbi:MAG: sugar phosphate isomerase/epimerase [Acidobacteriia bacterium]|nr:sugar phosphate isomerase/epimerase [Terriglobia bacterium]
MHAFSRRQFMAGSLAAAAVPLHADPLGMPIGCQTYPVREALGKDFPGTLKQLAGIGYKTIEMCSPPGYANAGYGALVSLKAAEMKKIIADAGLRCESCHYQFKELKENLDERIAFARELGLKQMVLSTFGLPNDAGMADWVRAAGDLNKIADKTRQAGIQTGFHNHNFEFREIDGVLVYDKLMGEFDAKLVKMQFQVAVISLGYRASTYMRKYPGRFLSLHLADWSAETKKQAPVGQGSVDWKELFAAAKTGGVKNYFVEQDMDALKAGYPYLHGLKA